MWWSDRRGLLIGLAGLAGCGFRPAYGPGGPAEGLTGQIAVAAPTDREGYELVRRLEARLGQPRAARYDLGFTLAMREVAVGITPEQETRRYNVTGSTDYTLTDRRSGLVVATGSVDGFTGYAATGSTVSTLEAQEDARRRLATILADALVSRLVSTAAQWRT